MLLRRLYYRIKPLMPYRLRYAMRRHLAMRKLRQPGLNWPIDERAGVTPSGWNGWPEGKEFAFVITHDVEGAAGLAKCRQLAELERELGFRSSFNFIPEGGYETSPELREYLVKSGFEVGVHDLHHDGHLYRSRRSFIQKAARINRYLKEWNAVGFRSGFMHHNYEWLHDLDVLYDASSFDTDPFEPQPDGVRTIFPFWIPASAAASGSTFNAQLSGGRKGYVELPYTLPQDSTLFLILQERSNAIWKQKLDWIVDRGGMALFNVHPDYIAFDEKMPSRANRFPVALYREFLEYVKARYLGKFWHPLPRELAAYAAGVLAKKPEPVGVGSSPRPQPDRPVKVWIDLDNTPHVPLFIPIIRELEKRGQSVVVTARDAFQVCALADEKKLSYLKIGRHYGKNKCLKVLGLIWRAAQLVPFCLRHRPDLAVSHGARSQILLCNLLRIPTILILDYEHARTPPLVRPRWEIVPDSLPSNGLHASSRRVRQYRGIKEDVYAAEFSPDPSLAAELDIADGRLVIVVRPPATEAHYHNPEAEILLGELMGRICRTSDIRAVLLPRNRDQEEQFRSRYPEWFIAGKTTIPARAVDGLNLLWHSDLVVSGGGTMNREAAALGLPVYSIFRGPMGAVDRKLEQEGRLVMISSVDEVNNRISFKQREKLLSPDNRPRPALQDIVGHIEEIIRIECR